MMLVESTYAAEIDGNTYLLRSNCEEERLQEIASYVAEKIQEVRRQAPHYSSTRATMLTALQIAEELLALRDEYAELIAEASNRGSKHAR